MNITPPKNSHQELKRSVFCIFLRGEKRERASAFRGADGRVTAGAGLLLKPEANVS